MQWLTDLLHNSNLQECSIKSSSHLLAFVLHLLFPSLFFTVPIRVHRCFAFKLRLAFPDIYITDVLKVQCSCVRVRRSLARDFTISDCVLSDIVYMVVSHWLLMRSLDRVLISSAAEASTESACSMIFRKVLCTYEVNTDWQTMSSPTGRSVCLKGQFWMTAQSAGETPYNTCYWVFWHSLEASIWVKYQLSRFQSTARS